MFYLPSQRLPMYRTKTRLKCEDAPLGSPRALDRGRTACLAVCTARGAVPVRGRRLGRWVGFEPDYLLDHNQVLCRLSYHRHDRTTYRSARADVSEPFVHGRRGGATRTQHLSQGRQFQRGIQPCRCAEGGRIELPRACASAVFKTVPVAIRRVGPPGCASLFGQRGVAPAGLEPATTAL